MFSTSKCYNGASYLGFISSDFSSSSSSSVPAFSFSVFPFPPSATFLAGLPLPFLGVSFFTTRPAAGPGGRPLGLPVGTYTLGTLAFLRWSGTLKCAPLFSTFFPGGLPLGFPVGTYLAFPLSLELLNQPCRLL